MLDRLKEIILEKSFKYSEKPVFKLAHGDESNFYFNCKPAVLDPEGALIIAQLVFDRIKDFPVSAIGGLELGSVPISCAVTLFSQMQGKPLKSFIVRKRSKDHGTAAKIEGELKPGENVVVVDDVITTGKSTIDAIMAVQQAGAKVLKAVAIVDREECDGRQNILKYCPDVEALIKRTEIMEIYARRGV